MESRARWMAGAVGVAIVTVVMLPPFVGEGVRRALMDAFAAVCHQLPDRSPHVGNVPLAVCHRCLGIYAGIPFAALLFPVLHRRLGPLERHAPWILGASLVPLSVDWAVDVVGLVSNVPWSRAATGWIFGLVAGYFLVRAVADLVKQAEPGAGARDEAAAVSTRTPS